MHIFVQLLLVCCRRRSCYNEIKTSSFKSTCPHTATVVSAAVGMADLDSLKSARSSAKRAVTTSATRLQHGISLRMDSVPDMAKNLDTKYCDFLSATGAYRAECIDRQAGPEYTTINNLTLDQYDLEVQTSYVTGRDAYRTYVSSFTMQSSLPHNTSVTRGGGASSGGLSNLSPASGASTNPPVYLKKREVPKFSGRHKDWPEFKSVWEKIVVPSLLNKTALATELKLSCKGGPGYDEISNISAGSETAYEDMWKSLCVHFDNVTLSVNSALDEMTYFKRVIENDYSSIVKLIRGIDSIYQQLKVLKQIDMVTNREVNTMMSYFPPLLRKDWAETYYLMESSKQLKPFESLHGFLDEKMKCAKLMADTQQTLSEPNTGTKNHKSSYNASTAKPVDKCVIHGLPHSTDSCRLFLSLSISERRDKLSTDRRCFRCFGNHPRAKCRANSPCGKCGRTSHHTLMCSPPNDTGTPNYTGKTNARTVQVKDHTSTPVEVSSASRNGSGVALYAIFEVPVTSSSHKAVVFCDDGADASFISEAGVRKLKATKIRNAPIEMTTLNGTQTVPSSLYEITLVTTNGKRVSIVAFSLPQLTGSVSKLSEEVIHQIFPGFDLRVLRRPEEQVDLLLGGDYFGLHPKHEVASDGKHLSVMQGDLGVCLQGFHPLLRESTTKDSCFGHTVTERCSHRVVHQVVIHPEYNPGVNRCQAGVVSGSDSEVSPSLSQSSNSDGISPSLIQGSHPDEVNQSLNGVSPPQVQSSNSDVVSPPQVQSSSSDVVSPPQVQSSSSDAVSPSLNKSSSSEVSPSQGLSSNCEVSPSLNQSSSSEISPSGDMSFNSEVSPSLVQSSDFEVSPSTDPSPCPSLSQVPSCNDVGLSLIQANHSDGPLETVSFNSEVGVSPQKQAQCFSVSVPSIDSFIIGEQLGTEVMPKCGACKCGKCPIMGHTYSFKEEQELKLINSKLHYDEKQAVWVTGYPWICDPYLLPNNYPAAMATLKSTEKKLSTDSDWASKYSEQIKDHEDRGVARKLSREELDLWSGPVFYLSHMALEQPKSLTTPVRLVFNSSQIYRGISLNSFLAKGPDCYNNNLLGMLLRWRENPVVMVGDIKKMYNSVFLEELEQHTHRFLWRDLEDRPPDTWCMTRVNLGDRPAGTIAIVAKDMTADMFKHINERAAHMIKYSTYTDDIIDSIDDFPTALQLSEGVDLILSKGGFKTKGWTFGGSGVPDSSSEVKVVLGVSWVASEDVILFPIVLNFSPKRRNVHTGPNMTSTDIPHGIPSILTRRIVLQQVMMVFDPFGFLAPFLLRAKVLLRETWILQLGWDDPLPSAMCSAWVSFFIQLFEIEHLRFSRCVKPDQAVGSPMLILLSDGSEIAYGCAAYIRWTLEDGSYWCRLLLAKCRIAPINRISIPQMELNGAVLSKRCRKVIESECRFKFDKTLHLVDSETVLGMINKLSTRFKVYEGVRVGEIQAATQGDVSCWGWISGTSNIADWVTRGRGPGDVSPSTAWFVGPDFLYTPIETWNTRFSPLIPDAQLPGEKKVHVEVRAVKLNLSSYARCSSLAHIVGALARVIAILRSSSFKGGSSPLITPELLTEAERHLLQEAQSSAWTASSVKLQFRTLLPVMLDGLWVVGVRISHCSPLTPDNKPQILLPNKHPLTRMMMEKVHRECCHRGRDGTLAKFRARFWTAHASKMSKSVCEKCQLCKLINAKRLSQLMGQMPPARLSPAPPFDSVMLDLFGPYHVRGEVQKRTTGKAWGVIFTDLCCRAVHIEVMFGYDTKSFLLALSRFAAVRGWPSKIFSDPGSQLRGASEELRKVWKSIDQQTLKIHGSRQGLKWTFGPTDSPWYQGAVEALIKSAKKAIHLSVKDRRL